MENREIERKWLVKDIPTDLEKYECHFIEQAYLHSSPTVRVRRDNDDFYLTYKGSKNWEGESEISHTEYNLPLDEEAYEHLADKRDGRLITKKRYIIPIENGLNIELDVFEGDLAPLVVAEVEFESEEEAMAFTAPEWFGEDVSRDYRYKNAYMATRDI